MKIKTKLFEKPKFINAGMLGKGLGSTANLWKALNITRNIMKQKVLLMRGCLRKDWKAYETLNTLKITRHIMIK